MAIVRNVSSGVCGKVKCCPALCFEWNTMESNSIFVAILHLVPKTALGTFDSFILSLHGDFLLANYSTTLLSQIRSRHVLRATVCSRSLKFKLLKRDGSSQRYIYTVGTSQLRVK